MTIEFSCQCGRKLSVPDSAAGRKAKCPACNAVLDVPGEAPAPEPKPEQPASMGSKVDDAVNRFGEDFAASQERAPKLTRIAMIAGGAAMGTLLFTLVATVFSDYFGLVSWLLVWLPMSALSVLVAVLIIKADPRTPALANVAAPAAVGANWAMLWTAAGLPGAGGAVAMIALVALINAAGYIALYLHFKKEDTLLMFPPAEAPAEEAPIDAETETAADEGPTDNNTLA